MDRSVLELTVDGLPSPHAGAGGEWRYRHAVREEGATALDHQAVTDFLTYEPGYPPAVRFYFAWHALATQAHARFDGVHPVKMRNGLRFDDVLVAVVVPASERHVVRASAGRWRGRLVILDAGRRAPQDWAAEATAAARQLT